MVKKYLISLANTNDNTCLTDNCRSINRNNSGKFEREQTIRRRNAAISTMGEMISSAILSSVKDSEIIVPVQVLFSFKLNDQLVGGKVVKLTTQRQNWENYQMMTEAHIDQQKLVRENTLMPSTDQNKLEENLNKVGQTDLQDISFCAMTHILIK